MMAFAARPTQSIPRVTVPRWLNARWTRGLAGLAATLVLALCSSAAGVRPQMLLLDGVMAGTKVVVVGERGAILASTDHGRNWQAATVPSRATLTGVSFAPDGQHGWAVGHDATILATTDGGSTWIRQYHGENLQDSFLDVLAIDSLRIFAIGAYGLYQSSSDGGKTWTRRKLGPDDYHFNRISAGPTGTLYLAGEHGTLLRSTDSGANWTPIPAPYDGSFYGVIPLSQRILLAHGLRGRVYRSADDGTTWEPVNTSVTGLLAAGTRLKSGFLILAGQSRAFLQSKDLGKTFHAVATPITTALAEVIELPDGNLVGVGEAGVSLLPAVP